MAIYSASSVAVYHLLKGKLTRFSKLESRILFAQNPQQKQRTKSWPGWCSSSLSTSLSPSHHGLYRSHHRHGRRHRYNCRHRHCRRHNNILTKQTKRTMSSVIECAELFFLGAGISLCSAFLRRASSCQCRAEAATTDHCSELFITISSHDRRRWLWPRSPPTPLSVRSTSISFLGRSSGKVTEVTDHLVSFISFSLIKMWCFHESCLCKLFGNLSFQNFNTASCCYYTGPFIIRKTLKA